MKYLLIFVKYLNKIIFICICQNLNLVHLVKNTMRKIEQSILI